MRTVGIDETRRLPARTWAIEQGLSDHQFELTEPQSHDDAHSTKSWWNLQWQLILQNSLPPQKKKMRQLTILYVTNSPTDKIQLLKMLANLYAYYSWHIQNKIPHTIQMVIFTLPYFTLLLLLLLSIGTTAHCGVWPVEQCLSILSYLSPTLSIFSLPALEDFFYLYSPPLHGPSSSFRPFQFLSEDLFGHLILLHSLQVTQPTYPLPLYPFYYIFSFTHLF